jgi:aryl-alcohol dehydrogenase-like predicted oxidoreductase
LAEALHREQMSLLAYSPLAMGALTGKYANGGLPANSRFALFDQVGVRFRKPIVFEAVDAYAKLARRRGLTLVQLAMGYVRSRWFTSATIIGATSMAQLAEDIEAAQCGLDPQTLAEIADIQVHYPNPAN